MTDEDYGDEEPCEETNEKPILREIEKSDDNVSYETEQYYSPLR